MRVVSGHFAGAGALAPAERDTDKAERDTDKAERDLLKNLAKDKVREERREERWEEVEREGKHEEKRRLHLARIVGIFIAGLVGALIYS